MDSGFDLNLDSEQFSSENLHSIEYWEQELDHVVNTQRELLSTPQQKTDFDVMVLDILEELRMDNEVLDAELQDVMDNICEDVANLVKEKPVLDPRLQGYIDRFSGKSDLLKRLELLKQKDVADKDVKAVIVDLVSRDPKSFYTVCATVLSFDNRYKPILTELLSTKLIKLAVKNIDFVYELLGFDRFFTWILNIEDLALDSDRYNKVLSLFLEHKENILDNLLVSDTSIKSQYILFLGEAKLKGRPKALIKNLISDLVRSYPLEFRVILTEFIKADNSNQNLLKDLLNTNLIEFAVKDIKFVYSNLYFPDFFGWILNSHKTHFDGSDYDYVLILLSKHQEDIVNLYLTRGGPCLFEMELEVHNYNGYNRSEFVEFLVGAKSKGNLSKESLAFLENFEKSELKKFESFIENPLNFSEAFSWSYLENYLVFVQKKLSKPKFDEFCLKLLPLLDLPEYSMEINYYLTFNSWRKFQKLEPGDQFYFLSKVIKLAMRKGLLSSKLANLIFSRSGDYQYLAISRDNYRDGIFTEFDGLNQNENWIEDQTRAQNGFSHVQAFSQIGGSLELFVGDSDELIITYPGSGNHISLIETVARGFANPNLSLKSATIKLTEVEDRMSSILRLVNILAKRTGRVSEVGTFIEDEKNPQLSTLNFKVLGKPVKIEFYLNAFDSETQDDWFGYENLRASQMIVLHDLGSHSLYSVEERIKIINFVQYVSEHGLPLPMLNVNFNSEHPSRFTSSDASEDIITVDEFVDILRSRASDIDLKSIDSLFKSNPNGLTDRQKLDLFKMIRMSKNEIDNLEVRLQSIIRFILNEKQSKIVVMDFEHYESFIKKFLFANAGVDTEVLEADPGAIYGCDCNDLAHQGMVVVRLSPSSKE